MLARIVCFFALASAIYAMKCYQGNGYLDNIQNANTPPAPILTDCAYQITTCLKSVDWTTRMYSKSCGNINNCTQGTFQNSAYCTNTTMNNLGCCCYGESCNSAPTSSVFFAGAAAIISLGLF